MGASDEVKLREHLGIPVGARHVLILAESSHWDPDWLYTWDEYFRGYARGNLDQALDELERDPRRIYSIECLFFLQMYWEARPERRAEIRELINSRRLRLTSTGITTADTLVTSTEAILRDWLAGQEWLRRNGMTVEPRLAYFPDCFGSSPALPSLLNAAGFDQTAITRLDGMLFVGCDWPLPGRFPSAGSSAAWLLQQEHCLDFVWRDRSGGEVLCHWNAFTYGQGDMLAHSGLVRMYLYPWAIPNRSERHVCRRIHQYARQLLPLSRTPYLFCPIGFDFVAPILDLVPLLDRYNQRRYPQSGIWALNAGLDDYLALVDCHRDRLPVIELDPNPYWTGFYSARPALKALAHDAVDRLRLAEAMAPLPENAQAAPDAQLALEQAWAQAVVANHHDFITGTSSDRVAETEQLPFLRGVAGRAEAVLTRLTEHRRAPVEPGSRQAMLACRQADGLLEIETPTLRVVLAEDAGGCIVSICDAGTGERLLDGPSNDLVCYEDSGGLWRMGMEFLGGRFREVQRASQSAARLEVRPCESCLEVASTIEFEGMPFVRTLWFRADTPVIRGRVHGRAPERRTVTACFKAGFEMEGLTMDVPGGISRRPLERLYTPTFWAAESFVHAVPADGGPGVALLLAYPGAVAGRPGGALDLVTLRNAVRETAFGFVHFPGQPAAGHERLDHNADFALVFTSAEGWWENALLAETRRARAFDPAGPTLESRLADCLAEWLAIDPPQVVVLAVKPAWRGPGIIVRLLAPESRGKPIHLRLCGRRLHQAWLCDARE